MDTSQTLEQKLDAYKGLWARKPRTRPLIGVDVGGWFPFQRFASLAAIPDLSYIEPEMLQPEAARDDYAAFLRNCMLVPDDLIKGVAPIPAIPWMEGVLGARLRRNKDSVWADEQKADWDELAGIIVENDNPWLRKYLSFVEDLTAQAGGRYPVGLPILRGVSDMFGMLRGHMEALIDCVEEPERARQVCGLCADALIALVGRHHQSAGDFHGGYFIEQYAMWAPGTLVRMQEDESAVYSPTIYDEIIAEADRKIAQAFDYSLIHLHSSSLFLIDHFLAIPEITMFEINKDICEMELPEMIPYLRKIQEHDRLLYVRGPLARDDFALINKKLAPEGLVLQTVVGGVEEGREVLETVRNIYR